MPPKKRGRNVRAASTPSREDATIVETPEVVESSEIPENDPLKDLWTDEQETSLLKGIIKWKPAGKSTNSR